ncbi:bifunctional acetate--CoA ligase family protein/GNAT family N-acetyltransferase [Kribbia dieselivorans]|uniref:bifunctional acetate--CoA ligase family protein/GNAT family N-acetyltransferase n=1 Tax=Kribbia dieselivorans TaxID=331526 RepID=UPI000838EE17|nr:GNAT family N-acetyltransferase [Kribbia dieselivorans]
MTDTALPDAALPDGYPAQAEADVVLRDGSVAHVRPIRPDDTEALHAFHNAQSDESIYLRFFAPMKRISNRDMKRFTEVDYEDRMALVATIRDEIIGVGRYDKVGETSAEVAFNISDHYHGKGIGSVMLEHLAAIAQEHGLSEFVAEVLPQNRKMLNVFTDAGYTIERHFEDGVVHVSFAIHPTRKSQAVRFAREHRAESKSIQGLLNPASVVFVGASRRERNVGHQVLRHIVETRFTGRLEVIHPEVDEILGVPTVRSLADLEGPIDLAVVAVPAQAVGALVPELARLGVKGMCVISSGFAETGPEGLELQLDLVRDLRDNGMRLVGPNSFGLINNSDAIRLNATLSPIVPPRGRFGIFSQSGALALAVLDSADRRNLGVSTFASAGNRADVSGNDLMQYWIDDDETQAVGMYLESMGNPRKFTRIARMLSAQKPVIVVKSTLTAFSTPPGQTVRASKASPAAMDQVLNQSGVVRVESIREMFDVAQLVLHQSLPAGNRVAVVCNSAQLGAVTADSCVARGLDVTHGPVAVHAEADGAAFRQALDAAFDDPFVDSVVACFIPPLVTLEEEVVRAVREAAGRSDKPCVATLLGLAGVDGAHDDHMLTEVGGDEVSDDAPVSDEAPASGKDGDGDAARVGVTNYGVVQAIPLYPLPDDAVRALAKVTEYGAWRSKDRGEFVVPRGLDRRKAREIIDGLLDEDPDGRALTDDESAALLACYGIKLWRRIEVHNAEEAVAAADELGYPVVLKSLSPLVRGSSLINGVRTDLTSAGMMRQAFETLDRRLAPLQANQFVVQGMAPTGVPCVLSTTEDPAFGPLISFAVAGATRDLLDDIGYRVPPLTDVDIQELIGSIKAAPLLDGHQGLPPVDRRELADVIARVSVLTDDIPELASLELNPVMAHGHRADVLGCQAMLAPPDRRVDPGRRSMT